MYIARVTLYFILWTMSGWANPTNPQVIFGSAQFNTNGSVLQVTTLTAYTVIRWDDFSIQNLETTQFLQLSDSSLVINIVVGFGATMTTVNGLLTGNGKIWIINPNSFFVGQDGIIQTTAFLAASFSLNVIDDHWWDSPNVASSASFFVNKGTIQTTGGDLILLCNNFTNDGILEVATDSSMFIVMLQKTTQEIENSC